MEKIEDGVNSPKDDDLTSSSNRSTAEENTSEDDNTDSSIDNLHNSENISDY